MNIYNYDNDGVYIGPDLADESPLEPGVYLIPRNATTVAPPSLTLPMKARWENGEWTSIEDRRGTVYWIGYNRFVQENFGPLPVGASIVNPGDPPPAPLTLGEKRAQAVLSRAQFSNAMRRDGWWTKAEAKAFAAGEVPPDFTTILEQAVEATILTQDQADEAEIVAAGLVQVERAHPIVPIAAGVYDMTDEEVDALFGIE